MKIINGNLIAIVLLSSFFACSNKNFKKAKMNAHKTEKFETSDNESETSDDQIIKNKKDKISEEYILEFFKPLNPKGRESRKKLFDSKKYKSLCEKFLINFLNKVGSKNITIKIFGIRRGAWFKYKLNNKYIKLFFLPIKHFIIKDIYNTDSFSGEVEHWEKIIKNSEIKKFTIEYNKQE